MQYRRFGNSELVVSDVGFGAWTIANGLVGQGRRQGRPRARRPRRRRRRSSTPRRSTATTVSARRSWPTILGRRDDVVVTTKVGYDIDAPSASRPGSRSALTTGDRSRSARRSKPRCAGSAPTTSTSPTPQRPHRARPRRRVVGELVRLQAEGKVRELGVALGPAIGWVDEGLETLRPADRARCRRCSTCSSRSPASRSRPSRRSPTGRVGPDLPGAARVRHALGQDHARHRVPARRRPPRPPQPREHARQLRQGRRRSFLWEGTGRTIGQAAVAGILANPAFTTVLPTCVTSTRCASTPAASDLPLTH